ncbi:carboxylesterase family protein-like protein [Cercophora scortea]|uniref:Carboxylic ester hydrolase n=1 Tax=Cercophora scortea TaxID=314031 RepID=A0AAE0I6W3_9PEZI|nr:carboxylesterase family protein-like protein [Cercophora scortea]
MATVMSVKRLLAFFFASAFAAALPTTPEPPALSDRLSNELGAAADAPVIDLDYAQYQGVHNTEFNTNVYRGIRFAARPKRWQLPEAPKTDRSAIIAATSNPPRCPQSNPAPRPATVDFNSSILGNEDCLFLNVFAPANATKLPVLFWIHGGGYGAGSASSFDFSFMDQTVGNGFISVVIQYRLGAFGFLSSADVAKHGTANAGLYDMRFALQWVQKYIDRFGGDPNQVTIAGESAGGGSVMLMAMANGGNDGTSLFRRAIASSPYLPTQPDFNDPLPTDYYLQFAKAAGCVDTTGSLSDNDLVFKCLQSADTLVLQNASSSVSYGARYGQWAFIPVTDGQLIQQRPTQQLLGDSSSSKVNGERIITGNNANEGTYFIPQNITTESSFLSVLTLNYPSLTPSSLAKILTLYSIPTNATLSPKFDTNGLTPPYATEVSAYASGWQQAANNLYAETTFVCPAYWLADAYSTRNKNKKAWRYQFSIPNAFHGADMSPLLSDPTIPTARIQDPAFIRGFQGVWGRFILTGDPTATTGVDAVGAAGSKRWRSWGGEMEDGAVPVAAVGEGGSIRWGHDLLNLNVTSGAPSKADWTVVDGDKWEGGRGERCALWAELAGEILE